MEFIEKNINDTIIRAAEEHSDYLENRSVIDLVLEDDFGKISEEVKNDNKGTKGVFAIIGENAILWGEYNGFYVNHSRFEAIPFKERMEAAHYIHGLMLQNPQGQEVRIYSPLASEYVMYILEPLLENPVFRFNPLENIVREEVKQCPVIQALASKDNYDIIRLVSPTLEEGMSCYAVHRKIKDRSATIMGRVSMQPNQLYDAILNDSQDEFADTPLALLPSMICITPAKKNCAFSKHETFYKASPPQRKKIIEDMNSE